MSADRRRGQTLLVAALLALTLCVAVLATLSIGHAAHERVRLQHTADATAYSMATAEARAFNAYAVVNRAHASHYVSAMLWQSLLSHLFFTEAFLTDLSGLAETFPCLRPKGPWVPICRALERIPALGSMLRLLRNVSAVLKSVTRAYQTALNGGDPGTGSAQDLLDREVGLKVVPSFLEMNAALSAVAQSLMRGTHRTLQESAERVVRANDPTLDSRAAVLDAGGYSACLFAQAHATEALGRPDELPRSPFHPLSPSARRDADRTARTKRAMAGVANATRYACEEGSASGCPDTFITARRGDLMASLPGNLGALSKQLAGIPKWGQTRLLSFGMGGADGQNFLREPDGAPDVPTGMLTQGDNLGSDDVFTFPLGPFACRATDPPERCWGEPRKNLQRIRHPSDSERPFRFMTKTSIWALNAEERLQRPFGVHWRVAYPHYPSGPGHVPPADLGGDHPELARLGLHEARRRFFGLASVSVYIANVRAIQDGNHPWPGVVPFPNFEPGQFEAACESGAGEPEDRPSQREDDFNQPSVWVSLEKRREALATVDGMDAVAPRSLRVDLGMARLDTALAREASSHAHGLHAFARAQVYYHRPGDWTEQPNFFNPFWRARLAATLQGRGLAPPLRPWLDSLPEPLRRGRERVLTH